MTQLGPKVLALVVAEIVPLLPRSEVELPSSRPREEQPAGRTITGKALTVDPETLTVLHQNLVPAGITRGSPVTDEIITSLV
jgi:hypothetical protein